LNNILIAPFLLFVLTLSKSDTQFIIKKIMKTKIFTIALAFITLNAFSQITVTDNDVVGVGDNIYEALDSVSGSAIQIGSAGANQTWDFSNLQQNDVNIIQNLAPSSTSFGSMHSSSNLCSLGDDGQYVYMNKSSNGIKVVGVDDQLFLNPVTILPLPLSYPMQFSTGPVLYINETQENTLFPDSLALLVTSGAAHTIDSIKIQAAFDASYTVDGWGSVIIPMGTFPALRLYGSITNTPTVSLYCTDIILGIYSGWYPAPSQLFPTQTEISYRYQWWSNDPAVKFTLLNIDVDEFGNNNGNVQFLTNNPTSIKEKNDLQFSVFPVPATYSLTIEGEENIITDLTLRDINGKLILTHQFNTSTNLSLDGVAKGIYYLTLKTENGELTKKVVVE
jgi:hypothetical protein